MPWVAGLSVRVLTHERAQTGSMSVVDALTDLVQRQNLAGITVTRALEGLSDHSGWRSSGMLDLGEDLPLVVEIVDRLDRIEPLLPRIAEIVTAGVLTVADVRLYFPASHLRVRDIMRQATQVAREDTPLATILDMLLERGARLIPVIAPDGTLRGIITLSHLLQGVDLALAPHLSEPGGAEYARQHLVQLASTQTAAQRMLSHPMTIRPEQSLDAAGRIFTEKGITRMPVVDANQKLLGIVSEHDVVSALLEPPLPTAGEHAAALRLGVHPAEGEPLTAGSLADRSVPVLDASAGVDDVVRAVFGAPEPLALVVDKSGRMLGIIDEHALLARALPEAPAGARAVLARFFSRTPEPLAQQLGGPARRGGETMRAAQLVKPPAVRVEPELSAASALARMIAPPGQDYAIVVGPDGNPEGVLWRQTALRALVGG